MPVTINEQVEAALEPFGKDPRPEQLPEMQRRADAAFAQALQAYGLAPVGYRLIVHIDELVGPMCFVTDPRGRSWPLPAFSGEVERVVQRR